MGPSDKIFQIDRSEKNLSQVECRGGEKGNYMRDTGHGVTSHLRLGFFGPRSKKIHKSDRFFRAFQAECFRFRWVSQTRFFRSIDPKKTYLKWNVEEVRMGHGTFHLR